MADSLKLIRGDTNKLNLYVRRQQLDSDGKGVRANDGEWVYDPVNLTNATITLTARDPQTQAVIFSLTEVAGIQIQAPATAGNAIATIAPSVTASMAAPSWLDYDVEVIEGDSTKTTVARGRFVVSKDITHA